MNRILVQLVAAALVSTAAIANAGLVADVNADWSDTSNPNAVSFGSWSYRQGSSLLPHVPDWTPLGASPQPAWAPGTASGNFLPAIFKATSAQADWLAGDIVVHTTDAANGGANGPANILWTSPFAGTVDVSGAVWSARDIDRGNDWFVYLNNTLLSSGSVTSASSRASPIDLATGSGGASALTNISVLAGDTIRLELVRTTVPGDFVGLNFTVTDVTDVSAVPEPCSLILSGLGVGGLLALRLRRRSPAKVF